MKPPAVLLVVLFVFACAHLSAEAAVPLSAGAGVPAAADLSGSGQGALISGQAIPVFEGSLTQADFRDFRPAAGAGPAVLAFGKGGRGGVPSSRGFSYCKMGTSWDGNWNIVDERYVFGAGQTVVIGGHYEYLYDGRWAGQGWYQPDGATYYEGPYDYYIPDPADYGYQYWEWYNVIFYYSPMPSSMQNQEGRWTARWFDNGSVACTKNFTVMYVLSDHTMCAGVDPNSPYDPIDRRYLFTHEDARCYSWLRFDDFALNNTNDVKWRWYSPEGFYREEIVDIPDPGSGSWYGWYKCWAWIDIAGNYPATHPGTWHVEVYVKDYSGAYELKYTEFFEIEGPTPPDITVVPDFLVFDYTLTEPRAGAPPADPRPDAQSTTGPMPPPGMDSGDRGHRLVDGVLLPDVPRYIWYRGCGPTAAGMVIGYWDGRGFDSLVPGDASSQTPAVDAMISSGGNWNDYCLPLDYPPDPILPDRSEPPPGDEHVDDCVADFMKTSQSYSDNYYGWSWFSDVGYAMERYVSLAGAGYRCSTSRLWWSGPLWTSFVAEIDGGRPVVFLVDSDADGYTDHFVPAIGYDSGTHQYACLNTWDQDVHWYDFAQMAAGRPFGIFGAITFRLEGEGTFVVGNAGGSDLGITALTVQQGSPWVLGLYPSPPWTVGPGGNQAVTVRVDPLLAGPGQNQDRILIYSNDPDESPYPNGVFLTLTNPPQSAVPTSDLVTRTDLDAVVPNPGRGAVEVRYSVAVEGDVRLELFDAAGRLVTTLYQGRAAPGHHSARWNGVDKAGERVPAGVYFARLTAGWSTLSRRMVLLESGRN